MRLLTLEPHPNFGGGCEAMALAVSAGLAKRGHEISLLHESDGSMLPAYRQFVARALQVSLPFFSFRSPLRTLLCANRIGRIARAHKIDAILSSHLGFIRTGALLRVLYKFPSCFHLGLRPSTAYSAVSQLAYWRAGAGIAPSEHTREAWRNAGWPSDSLFTVPNWVDTDRFGPCSDRLALRKELGIPAPSRCIVFVGRIYPEKGVDDLVRAFPTVRSLVGDACLVIVGNGQPAYQRQLDQLIGELEEQDRSKIMRKSASPTPEKYFAAADVACVPSACDESFGLTLLEAMASSIPVVATSVGAFPQIIGKYQCDLIVPPKNSGALAERLSWWLTHQDAAHSCGRRLRDRVLRHYGSGPGIDAYEEILTKIIAP